MHAPYRSGGGPGDASTVDMLHNGSLTLFRARGIPIRAHWSLLLVLPYFAYMFSAQFAQVAALAGEHPRTIAIPPLVWGALLAVGLFASIAVHELAHSMVAVRAGGRVREITLLLLGGISQIESLPRRPRVEAVMAAVGPAASLALAGLLYGVHELWPHGAGDPRMGLFYLAHMNLVLAVFNILPAFPMDGGRVLRAVLATRTSPARATHIAATIGKGFAVAFAGLGLWTGNFLLFIIALFLYSGANAEAGMEREHEALAGLRVGDIMMRWPPVAQADAPPAAVAALLQEAGRGEAIIVDRNGAPAAIVRAGDLAEPRRRASAPIVVARPDEPLTDVVDRARAAARETIVVVVPGEGVVGVVGPTEIANALAAQALRAQRQGSARPKEA